MSTVQSRLRATQQTLEKIKDNPVERFSYTQKALDDEIVEGTALFDSTADQNVPLAGLTDYNDMVLDKGVRTQGASIPRMAWNHFIGRMSYNLNLLARRMASFMPELRSAMAHNANEYDPQAEYKHGDVCYIIEETDGGLTHYTWFRRSSSDSNVIVGKSPHGSPGDWTPLNETTVTDLAGDSAPLISGTASPGASEMYSREDHVHPIDTSRAPAKAALADEAASSTLPETGTLVGMAQTVRNSLKWLVAKFNASSGHKHDGADSRKIAYSDLAGLPTLPPKSTTLPKTDGIAAIGESDAWADAAHVHGTDTSRAPASATLADETASSILPETGTLVNIAQTVRNCLKWLAAKFSASSGHKHDGTDSRKIAYSDLTGLPTVLEPPAKSTTTPKMDGVAAAGSEAAYAGGDHVHPVDTSRAPASASLADETASSALPAAGTETLVGMAQTVRNCLKWLVAKFNASTGHKHNGTDSRKIDYGDLAGLPTLPAAPTTLPKTDGVAAIGDSSAWADAAHVHPVDTSRAPANSPTFTGTVSLPADAVGSVAGESATKPASEYQALLKTLFRQAQLTCSPSLDGDISFNYGVVVFSGSIAFAPVDSRVSTDRALIVPSSRFAAGVVIPYLGEGDSITCAADGTFVLPLWVAVMLRQAPGGRHGGYTIYAVSSASTAGLQANDIMLFLHTPAGLSVGGASLIPNECSHSETIDAAVYKDYRGLTQLTGDVTAPLTASGPAKATIKPSVALSGAPTAPTAPEGTSTEQLATTAFVDGERGYLPLSDPGARSGNGRVWINSEGLLVVNDHLVEWGREIDASKLIYRVSEGEERTIAIEASGVYRYALAAPKGGKGGNATASGATVALGGAGGRGEFKEGTAMLTAGNVARLGCQARGTDGKNASSAGTATGYMLIGSGVSFYSFDRETWAMSDLKAALNVGVAVVGERVICVASSSNYAYNTSSSSWTELKINNSYSLASIKLLASLVGSVAVGSCYSAPTHSIRMSVVPTTGLLTATTYVIDIGTQAIVLLGAITASFGAVAFYRVGAETVVRAAGHDLVGNVIFNDQETQLPGDVTGFAYNNGYMALQSADTDTNVLYASNLAGEWTKSVIRNFVGTKIKVINGAVFVLGGDKLAMPGDGGWTVVDILPGTLGAFNDISFIDGALIAVGAGGLMASSRDGVSWTREASPTNKDLFAIVQYGYAASASVAQRGGKGGSALFVNESYGSPRIEAAGGSGGGGAYASSIGNGAEGEAGAAAGGAGGTSSSAAGKPGSDPASPSAEDSGYALLAFQRPL